MNRRYEHINYPLVYSLSHHIATSFFDTVFRGEIFGQENIPEHGPFIIAANHASHLDPPLIATTIYRKMAPFARKTLWSSKLASWWFDAIGSIPVDRDGADIQAIKRVINTLNSGTAIILFPEGTRSPDGQLQPAKAGVGLLAAKTQVPILPVRIFNSHIAFPRGGKLHPLTPVHVGFAPLLQPADYDTSPNTKARYQVISDNIMHAISQITLPAEKIY